ncbi:DUF6519 domain-containing protein [Roseovarius sp. M141]|uniref:DUF6519 domain-containing protein n=1 Tax=Roseovarius sp. M141 TaxID=2583806 RepID=UPI0020CFA2D3|nr:DUF6519 domain-containing protein [Roseovarius sp. M141]MCQ0091208.1 hypothetical protein [Roseovarius sp. M141]
MKGDFSRWTAPNAAARHYSGVLMQQGRLHTDADWNEQVQIGLARSEAALGDIIGQAGTPKGEGGFAISAGAGGFAIGAGRYYLDGAMVQNDARVTYDDQGDGVAVPPLADAGGTGTDVIIYLEATRAQVTGLEDSRLIDPALSGVDTATRIKAAWRVGVEAITLTAAERDALIDAAQCGNIPDLAGWSPSTGALSARTLPAGALPDDSDCKIPPEAGYLSQENQLYRVEIITGGTRAQSRFVWSRENGAVEATLGRNTDGDFVLQGAIDDEALGFQTGNWVEVYDAADSYNARSGDLRQITLTDDVVTFSASIGDFTQMVRPRVRRWDQTGNVPQGRTLSVTPVELERGIEVSFINGSYRTGDYWVFEARAATGNIVWPQYPMEDPTDPVPPMGWGFRRAPLALARIAGAGLSNITDLRAEFPTLTCLHADDIEYDDSQCNMGAETVQEALDVLCRRTASGLCTFVVRNARELADVVAKLRQDQSARICLRAGNFALNDAVLFENLGHITVEGTGPQTVISVAGTEPALVFHNCASVRVVDLSVNGGPTGVLGRFVQSGRLGAITAVDCGDMAFERVRARCRAGLDRTAACISTRNDSPKARHGVARVLVRDCTLKVGQSQIGVQVIGARRAVIEDNVISAISMDPEQVRRRILADPVLVGRIRRSLLDFPIAQKNPGNVTIKGAGARDHVLPLDGAFSAKQRGTVPLPRGDSGLEVRADPRILGQLVQALRQNDASQIAVPKELRQHMTNLVDEAIRDPRGSAVVGTRRVNILGARVLMLARTGYMAQGITVAGAEIEDLHILTNRIEGANDAIRVAASTSGDPNPSDWRQRRPPNTVRRARIEGNVITLQPVASGVEGHGIYLGHVDNVTVGQNDISGGGTLPNSKVIMPHFGLYQYGYRGPRFTVTENTVTNLYHGYAVVPELYDDVTGIWRLRDNATQGCPRPFAVATGVEVL